MAAGEAAPAFAHIGTGRIPCARRLQPDDAAIGRGNTDRAAAIGAVGRRHHARRDGRRGAAAGAARTVLQVPGIARRAVDHRLRRRVQTELRRVGAPEDHQPGPLVTLDDGEIMVGDEAVIEMRPVPHPRAGVPGVDILQQERHARQRALRQSRLQSLPRLIVHLLHDRIEPGIQRLDPPDRRLQHFRRRDLLLGNQFGQAEGVIPLILWEYGHAAELRNSRRGMDGKNAAECPGSHVHDFASRKQSCKIGATGN